MRFVIALIMTSPALLIIAFGLTPEYWSRIYPIWGLFFASLSFIFTFRLLSPSPEGQIYLKSVQKFFGKGLTSWVISFAGLAIINFTPLCLGQDNGDGNNSVNDCILLTFIWPVSSSIFTIPAILIASFVARKVLEHWLDRISRRR